jgi:hypothetical protein
MEENCCAVETQNWLDEFLPWLGFNSFKSILRG